MEPRPIRMPDELWNAIEEDAKAHNRMAAEHVRHICREYLEEDSQPMRERIDDLGERLDRLEDLERRVERLERKVEQREPVESASTSEATDESVGEVGESARRRGATSAEASTPESATESAGPTVNPEPIEDIDDVLIKARQEYGQYDRSETGERRLDAARDALKILQDERKVEMTKLRDRVASEYAPRDVSEEVWWAETVQPALQIAAEWGLVVSLSGGKLEWVGPPAE